MRRGSLSSLIAFSLSVSVPASANLLINGGFEDQGSIEFGNTGGFWFATLSEGSTELPGWVVTRGTIDYWSEDRSSDFAPDGDRALDLDGTPGFGGLAQSFATTPGQPYRVRFFLSGNPHEFSPEEPEVKLLRILAAGVFADFSFDTTGQSGGPSTPWTRQTWTFFAIDATTTLEFQSMDTAEAGYSGAFGPYIDGVVVTLVPEPSTALLVLTGGLLLGGRRREGPG